MLTENREHYPCRALYPSEIAYAIKAKEQNNDDENVLKHHIISFLHQTFNYPNAEIKNDQIDKICKCDQTASNVDGIHISSLLVSLKKFHSLSELFYRLFVCCKNRKEWLLKQIFQPKTFDSF